MQVTTAAGKEPICVRYPDLFELIELEKHSLIPGSHLNIIIGALSFKLLCIGFKDARVCFRDWKGSFLDWPFEILIRIHILFSIFETVYEDDWCL